MPRDSLLTFEDPLTTTTTEIANLNNQEFIAT